MARARACALPPLPACAPARYLPFREILATRRSSREALSWAMQRGASDGDGPQHWVHDRIRVRLWMRRLRRPSAFVRARAGPRARAAHVLPTSSPAWWRAGGRIGGRPPDRPRSRRRTCPGSATGRPSRPQVDPRSTPERPWMHASADRPAGVGRRTGRRHRAAIAFRRFRDDLFWRQFRRFAYSGGSRAPFSRHYSSGKITSHLVEFRRPMPMPPKLGRRRPSFGRFRPKWADVVEHRLGFGGAFDRSCPARAKLGLHPENLWVQVQVQV